MPMCISLEYSENFSMTSGRFWNHYGEGLNHCSNEDNINIYRVDNSITGASKYFQYKTKTEQKLW